MYVLSLVHQRSKVNIGIGFHDGIQCFIDCIRHLRGGIRILLLNGENQAIISIDLSIGFFSIVRHFNVSHILKRHHIHPLYLRIE